MVETTSKKEYNTLDNLVQSERFYVNNVISQAESTSISTNSEMRMGGTSSSYNAGYTLCIKLQVESQNGKIPIEELVFNGFSPVVSGQYIVAKIPRYIKGSGKIIDPTPFVNGKVYLDRDYTKSEEAIEISIIDNDNPSGDTFNRIDRSVNYSKYQKQS